MMETPIREYNEEMEVELVVRKTPQGNRLAIKAYNEGGCCSTIVDLEDIIRFVDSLEFRAIIREMPTT